MTSPQQSIDLLHALLAQAGFSATHPRFPPVWEAFQQFLAVPVDCAQTDALCQWGTYTSAPEAFEFTLTRQFSFAVGTEYTGMQQLHCTLSFPAQVAVGVDAGCSWASAFDSTAAFCADLETLEAFDTVATVGVAVGFAITLEEFPP
jgi:hypothetical protein